MKSLMMRMQIQVGPSAVASWLRVIIFLWNDSDTPTITDVLIISRITSLYTTLTSNKRRVLYDKTFVLSQERKAITTKRFIRINKVNRYTGTSSTSGQSGRIYQVLLSDEPSGATAPLFGSDIRLRYTDS